MNPKQPIPNNLRQERQKAGLRQFDVALSLGIGSIDRISRWEHGIAVPSIVNLFRLANLYKTNPQDLYPEVWRTIQDKMRSPSNPPQLEAEDISSRPE